MENPNPVVKDTAVAVAVKKGRNSQAALKWTIENLVNEGHMVTLVHVRSKPPIVSTRVETRFYQIEAYAGTEVRKAFDKGYEDILDMRAREMLQPFQSYCKRKKVESEIVVLDDDSIVSALADFVLAKNIDVLVMGAGSSRNVVKKFMGQDVTPRVAKKIPYFCTLYAIGRGKLQFVKSESSISQSIPGRDVNFVGNIDSASSFTNCEGSVNSITGVLQSDTGKEFKFRSPLKDYGVSEFTSSDSDISYVKSESEVSDGTSYSWLTQSTGWSSNTSASHSSLSTSGSDWDSSSSESSHPLLLQNTGMDEIHRLRLELMNRRSKYITCNEEDDELILASKLNLFNLNEDKSMKMMRKPQKSLSRAEGRRFNSTTSSMTTDISETISKEESLKTESHQGYRVYSTSEIETASNSFSLSQIIGQGRYGRVYACHLDHMPVAIKVLEANVATGDKLLFQKEAEILTAIKHPNLVRLLGACPDNSSLVYEYMRKGNLEDQLYRFGDTRALSWQVRFRIAAEIGTALLFLHRAKPRPIVHEGLTPRNILLDYNCVAKLTDFYLAKLMDPSAAKLVTKNALTQSEYASFVDPEYMQTGMLEPISNVYSLGVVMLQMLTAKSPVGLANLVRTAICTGAFSKILDPAVSDWPIEEALSFAQLALQCTQKRQSDRPDLALKVLPELNQLRKVAMSTII